MENKKVHIWLEAFLLYTLFLDMSIFYSALSAGTRRRDDTRRKIRFFISPKTRSVQVIKGRDVHLTQTTLRSYPKTPCNWQTKHPKWSFGIGSKYTKFRAYPIIGYGHNANIALLSQIYAPGKVSASPIKIKSNQNQKSLMEGTSIYYGYNNMKLIYGQGINLD
jgi:hypothetical protein